MSRGRAIWLVARRELLERGRSRAFVFSLLLSLAIIGAGVILPGLIGGASSRTLGVVGAAPAGATDGIVAIGKQAALGIRTVELPDLASAEADLKSGAVDAVLVFPPDGTPPTYIVKSERDALLAQVVRAAFTPQPQIGDRVLERPDANRETSFLFANAGVILLFISIFTFGTWLLTGVVEEKQSRVVEVVLSTVESRDLLIGKVLGLGILGIIQLVIMVAVGLGIGVQSGRFSLPPATPTAIAMLLLWFVLGYAFYSTALGVLGALASRMEEASNAASPVSLLATAAYLFSLLVALNDPSGPAARIATFLPPVAPMVVPLRTALGAIEPWEILASVALMCLAIWVLFVFGGRVYSGAVLATGGRIRLRDAWRSSFRS